MVAGSNPARPTSLATSIPRSFSSAGRAPPLQGGGHWFDPSNDHQFVKNDLDGSLAQSVEQLTFNQLVAGSNPARPTSLATSIPRSFSSAGRAPPLQGGGHWFDPSNDHQFVKNDLDGSLAQSVEQLTFNQLVAGSNPARPTSLATSIPRSFSSAGRAPPLQGGGHWFDPSNDHQFVKNDLDGSLAQSVEQLTFNQLVAGSNPARPTSLATSIPRSFSSAGRAPPLQGGGHWFDPSNDHQFVKNDLDGSLAQSVEQLTFNQLVAGSNPARPTSLATSIPRSFSSAGRAPPLQGGGHWFDPSNDHQFVKNDLDGSLAQSVEQLTFNQLVAGSNPARPTIISRIPRSFSSAGRAPPLQGGGHWFDPSNDHQIKKPATMRAFFMVVCHQVLKRSSWVASAVEACSSSSLKRWLALASWPMVVAASPMRIRFWLISSLTALCCSAAVATWLM